MNKLTDLELTARVAELIFQARTGRAHDSSRNRIPDYATSVDACMADLIPLVLMWRQEESRNSEYDTVTDIRLRADGSVWVYHASLDTTMNETSTAKPCYSYLARAICESFIKLCEKRKENSGVCPDKCPAKPQDAQVEEPPTTALKSRTLPPCPRCERPIHIEFDDGVDPGGWGWHVECRCRTVYAHLGNDYPSACRKWIELCGCGMKSTHPQDVEIEEATMAAEKERRRNDRLAQRVRTLLVCGWGLANPKLVSFTKDSLVRHPASTCEIITTEAELIGMQIANEAAIEKTIMTEADIKQENNNRLAKGVRRLIGKGNLFIWRYSPTHETCHHEKVLAETELLPAPVYKVVRVFERTFCGTTYVVEFGDDGMFHYNGSTYFSLNGVATAITGYDHSDGHGSAFFECNSASKTSELSRTTEEEEYDASYKCILTYERVFRGTTYTVQMDEDGMFHWEGKHYRSLTDVAITITGSEDVVGYEFFRVCETTPRDGADEKERDADRELGKQARKLIEAGRLAWVNPFCGFSIQDETEFMSQRR